MLHPIQLPAQPPPSPLTRDLADLERRYFPNPPAKDAAPHTRLGDAQPMIDGNDYFAALLGEIRSLQSGDLWYWSGWLTHANHPLDNPTGTATLSWLALDAVERGVNVRGLIWTNKVLIDHRGDIRDPDYWHRCSAAWGWALNSARCSRPTYSCARTTFATLRRCAG